MSVSAVTIRQDEPEHVLTTVRRTGRKTGKDVTRESDLARRIVQRLKHEDDEEVKYRKRMMSPRSVYKRVTGSVKKKQSSSRTIPKRELQKMGRRQLTELVKALRDEETSKRVEEHTATYNRDDEFLLGEAVYVVFERNIDLSFSFSIMPLKSQEYLTRTARKSLENNVHLTMINTQLALRARTQVQDTKSSSRGLCTSWCERDRVGERMETFHAQSRESGEASGDLSCWY